MPVRGRPAHDGVIHISEYDPDWPRQAAAAIDALRSAAPGVFVAVSGLAAKPVIDLMAAVHGLAHIRPHENALAALGFRPHDNGMTDRLLYVRVRDGVRSHILHLRAHPEDAARYAALKRAIVASGTEPGAYTYAKTALVQDLTDRARAARGLPVEQVWEKPH
ncbi:GrpB family protein [Streptomyces sp. NPDC048420]|uniref:GrpB family protein n=1 Tax=Streptomyces sp. NPDC048420 TaxID=3155755 RepID=UPI00342344FA